MAHNLKLSNAAVNAKADALAALANNGYLRIYSGSQPSDADGAITSQVLLAELRFANPAFGAAVDGVLTANPLTEEDDAPSSGTAAWYRVLESDGSTVLWDGSVGVSNADLTMATASIVQHMIVSLNSLTHTVSKG